MIFIRKLWLLIVTCYFPGGNKYVLWIQFLRGIENFPGRKQFNLFHLFVCLFVYFSDSISYWYDKVPLLQQAAIIPYSSPTVSDWLY